MSLGDAVKYVQSMRPTLSQKSEKSHPASAASEDNVSNGTQRNDRSKKTVHQAPAVAASLPSPGTYVIPNVAESKIKVGYEAITTESSKRNQSESVLKDDSRQRVDGMGSISSITANNSVRPHEFLLSSVCTVAICWNKSILSVAKDISPPLIVKISPDVSMKVAAVGRFGPFEQIYYAPDAKVNILPMQFLSPGIENYLRDVATRSESDDDSCIEDFCNEPDGHIECRGHMVTVGFRDSALVVKSTRPIAMGTETDAMGSAVTITTTAASAPSKVPAIAAASSPDFAAPNAKNAVSASSGSPTKTIAASSTTKVSATATAAVTTHAVGTSKALKKSVADPAAPPKQNEPAIAIASATVSHSPTKSVPNGASISFTTSTASTSGPPDAPKIATPTVSSPQPTKGNISGTEGTKPTTEIPIAAPATAAPIKPTAISTASAVTASVVPAVASAPDIRSMSALVRVGSINFGAHKGGNPSTRPGEFLLVSASDVGVCRDASQLQDAQSISPARIDVSSGEALSVSLVGRVGPFRKVYFAPTAPMDALPMSEITPEVLRVLDRDRIRDQRDGDFECRGHMVTVGFRDSALVVKSTRPIAMGTETGAPGDDASTRASTAINTDAGTTNAKVPGTSLGSTSSSSKTVVSTVAATTQAGTSSVAATASVTTTANSASTLSVDPTKAIATASATTLVDDVAYPAVPVAATHMVGFIHPALRADKHIQRDEFVLSSTSNVGVCNDLSKIEDARSIESSYVDGTMGRMEVKSLGRIGPFTKVFYAPSTPVNVLPMGDVKVSMSEIFDSDKNSFECRGHRVDIRRIEGTFVVKAICKIGGNSTTISKATRAKNKRTNK
jgi:hypothetical protein